jgi:hypothetical protein
MTGIKASTTEACRARGLSAGYAVWPLMETSLRRGGDQSLGPWPMPLSDLIDGSLW